MKIPWVLTTSDKYLKFLPYFAFNFNKYVGTYKIDVLCFKKPEHPLPKNFNVISLGKQSDYGEFFADPLIPYFNEMKSKFFFHILEDYLITKPMNHKLLKHVFSYCIKNNICPDKIDLSGAVCCNQHTEMTDKILLAEQTSRYRASLQCACWRTKYWKKILKRGKGKRIWYFEVRSSIKCRKDGGVILGVPKNNKILNYKNMSHRGRIGPTNRKMIKRIKRKLTLNQKYLDVKVKSYQFRGINENNL